MIGVDEAGVGPGFGPLVASAVMEGGVPEEACDSKSISEKKRERLYELIVQNCVLGIGIVSNEEIDELGLGRCRRLVFTRALDDLLEKHPSIHPRKIIVDGTIFERWRDVEYECVPRADQTIKEVSAASIVAKVTRDRAIYKMCLEDPSLDERYAISKNKGYLSSRHIEGIREHGLTKWHRRSYKIKT